MEPMDLRISCTSRGIPRPGSNKDPQRIHTQQVTIVRHYLNPFDIPLMPANGWTRSIILRHNGASIRYSSASGQRFYTTEEIYEYIVKNNLKLAIDLFSFDLRLRNWDAFNPMLKGVTSRMRFMQDVTNGIERMPISCFSATNTLRPPEFYYSNKIKYTIAAKFTDESMISCNCTDNCKNFQKCECQILTNRAASKIYPNRVANGTVGYQYKRLYSEVPTGIYECNHRCKCSEKCLNRVAQNDIQVPLQVFKTTNRGWGIRCLNDVPTGTFICSFAGVVMTEDEANTLGPRHRAYQLKLVVMGMAQRNVRGRQRVNYSETGGSKTDLIIDGTNGNVSRFFNHSCSPNTFCQNTFINTHDLKFPIVAMFTSTFINKGTELTIDYGCEFQNSSRPFTCKCDSGKRCRKYTK